MTIDVKELPPAYQVQALRKLAERERAKGRGPVPSPAAAAPQKTSKYHNKPTERVTPDGAVLRFDSQKEARRFDELSDMLQAGKIRDLKLQPSFTLQEAYTTTEGVRVRAIRYQADFSYELAVARTVQDGPKHSVVRFKTETVWVRVVEDVKSRATKTRVYEIKKKLMREKFGIEIQEV